MTIKGNLSVELFVINTGGNHIPLKRNYKIQRKIMNKKYPFQIIYETRSEQKNKNFRFIFIHKFINIILKLFIIMIFIKILSILYNLHPTFFWLAD